MGRKKSEAPRLNNIMFRVSDEEYAVLESLAKLAGSRSVSDFAYNATLAVVKGSGATASPKKTPQQELDDLLRNVSRLCNK